RRTLSSQDPQQLELRHGLEERAGADRVEQRGPRRRAGIRTGLATVPAERVLVELECAGLRAQRLLLVAEDDGGKEIEKAVLAGRRRICVVQSRRRLEQAPMFSAAPHERGDLLD